MPNKYGQVRSERKDLACAIVGPRLQAKKDLSIENQYERIAPAPDGRVRSSLSAVTTETSRLSSSAFFADPNSTNLQNLSKNVGYQDDLYRVRDCFIAPDGMKILAADYSKAEAILCAAYSRDWDFYDMLMAGDDVHTYHASEFFGKPEEEVTKAERHIGKTLTYASQYKASIWKLTVTVNKESDKTGIKLTQDDVRDLHDTYLDLHPLEEWWRWTDAQLHDKGHITNAFGLKRTFYNPNKEKRLKEALAYQPQSTVACAINEALISCGEELDEPGEVEIIHQIHDELFFYIREDLIDTIAPKIKTIMERPFEIHGREVHIPVDIQVGDRWEEHRKKDPEDDGRLREYTVAA